MTVITSTTDWVKTLADKDMMSIEAVLTDVYTSLCEGQENYALFDGGAHKGYHTIRMAALPGCEAIYAVEADPYMLRTLDVQLSRAVYPGTRKPLFGPEQVELWVVDKALQNDPTVERVKWKSSSSHVGRSSIGAEVDDDDTIWSQREGMKYRDVMSVPATTIDKILSHEKREVPFIKLDLEGADILSLMGAETVLRTKRPVVVYENSVHAPRVHGFSIEDFSNYLDRLGYVALDFAGHPMEPARWFGFFEAWLTPPDKAEWLARTLNDSLNRQGNRFGIAPDAGVRAPNCAVNVPALACDAQAGQHLSDEDLLDIGVSIAAGGDVPGLYLAMARRLWTHPDRKQQAVEAALGDTDWNEAGDVFCRRVRRVLETLDGEGLLIRKGTPKLKASKPGRQWMLDSGRMAWLLWLSARRQNHSSDATREKALWAEQSGAYRIFVRNVLQTLEADGIFFAQDIDNAA